MFLKYSKLFICIKHILYDYINLFDNFQHHYDLKVENMRKKEGVIGYNKLFSQTPAKNYFIKS